MEILIILFSILPFFVQAKFKKYIYFELAAIIGVILHGIYFFGPKIILLLAITYIVSTIAELVSLKTRFYCFGVKYVYNLQHKFFSSKINLLGVYPLEITFAWVMLKYVSFCLGVLISTAMSLTPFGEILLIPLILLSTDFILDPVSVNTRKLWHWEMRGEYFGIPDQNFLGWYLVGLVSTLIFSFSGVFTLFKINYLFILPIIMYAMVLKNFPDLYRQNKRLAILGSLPVVIWVLLGIISLIKLL